MTEQVAAATSGSAEAKKTGEYTKMVHFYGTAFQNFANMNAVFKVRSSVQPKLTDTHQVVPDQDGANLDGPDLDVLLLNTVMDNIRRWLHQIGQDTDDRRFELSNNLASFWEVDLGPMYILFKAW